MGFVFPDFKNKAIKASDFNDLCQLEGIDEVKKQLENIIRSKPQLKAYPIQEFLAQEFKQREMIIEPILPQKSLMMTFAKRGIGMTFFASYLACKIARGKDCFGDKWKVPKASKVLYVDGEIPAEAMQERFAGFFLDTDDKETCQNLAMLS